MLKTLMATMTICFLSTAMMSGCMSYDYEYPVPGVATERGYYFDPDYYDSYGAFHGRRYWFYDGHSYVHRDELPHGQMAHLRMGAQRGGERGSVGHAGGGGAAHAGGDGGAGHGSGLGGGDGGHGGGGGHGR